MRFLSHFGEPLSSEAFHSWCHSYSPETVWEWLCEGAWQLVHGWHPPVFCSGIGKHNTLQKFFFVLFYGKCLSNRFMKRILAWKLQAMNSFKFFSCSCLLTPVDVRMGWLKQMENASESGFEQKIRIGSWRDHGQAYQRTNSLNVGILTFCIIVTVWKWFFSCFIFLNFLSGAYRK